MNSIKQLIRTGVTAMCAVCLLSACSSTLDEALDGGNTARVLNNIQIGDFPTFGSEANNDTQTHNAAIGTYDEGKTRWENGDEILLKIVVSESEVTTAILVFDGTKWTSKQGTFIQNCKGETTVEAYYAPAYEWSNNILTLKEGKDAGTEEYLTYVATQNLSDGLSVAFGSRTYSRLRVATDAGTKITLTSTSFTTNDKTTTAESGISVTADSKGNAYFYGTWTENGSADISAERAKSYGRLKKTITLPTAVNAKSYAVADPEERDEWIIEEADYKTWSEDNCKSAPTKEEMMMYLGAGVYFDEGSTTGDGYYDGNVQTYRTLDGKTYHEGVWMKKKAYITGFSDGKANKVNKIYVSSSGESTNAECSYVGRPAANEINKYFFLPAAGYFNWDYYSAGFIGWYWSSTPSGIYSCALNFSFSFFGTSISVVLGPFKFGYLPMIAE